MSNLGKRCLVQSFPRAADYVLRAAIITAEYKDGTVDVSIFNPHSEGPASVRECSMPAVQSMGPIPLRRTYEKAPADYRGKWVAVLDEPAQLLIAPASLADMLSEEEKKALQDAPPGSILAVGKPNSGTKAKR